ncbi:MAG: cell division protein PerM [Micromonosporaceae bacterium]
MTPTGAAAEPPDVPQAEPATSESDEAPADTPTDSADPAATVAAADTPNEAPTAAPDDTPTDSASDPGDTPTPPSDGDDASHGGDAGDRAETTPVNPSADRPTAREPQPAPPRADPVRPGSLLLAAAMTGGWAAVTSFAPVLIVVLLGWFGSSAVSGGTAVRFAITGWLLGHGVPFTADGHQIGLVPLGLTALVVWRLVRAGAHTARAVAATPRDAPYVVVALGVTYGVVGGVAALFASTPGFTVSPVRALLTTAAVAGLASAPGAAVETGAVARLAERLPGPVRHGLRAGAIAALVLLAAGAALAGVATAVAYQDAVELYRGYQVGVAGGAGITLVGLLYAPNLGIWGTSYLVGPGFGFGTGTEVTMFHVSLGPLPAVPVLAGLPTGPSPAAAAVLIGVPVLVGMLAGVVTARRAPEQQWKPLLASAVLAGPVAGAVLGAASFAASGPLGSARLAEVGPVWWSVALVATLLVSLGAVLAAVAARLLEARR